MRTFQLNTVPEDERRLNDFDVEFDLPSFFNPVLEKNNTFVKVMWKGELWNSILLL